MRCLKNNGCYPKWAFIYLKFTQWFSSEHALKEISTTWNVTRWRNWNPYNSKGPSQGAGSHCHWVQPRPSLTFLTTLGTKASISVFLAKSTSTKSFLPLTTVGHPYGSEADWILPTKITVNIWGLAGYKTGMTLELQEQTQCLDCVSACKDTQLLEYHTLWT